MASIQIMHVLLLLLVLIQKPMVRQAIKEEENKNEKEKLKLFFSFFITDQKKNKL